MTCPRCKVPLLGVGLGPSLKLAARCRDCGSPALLPEGIVEADAYRCVKCGGNVVPDDNVARMPQAWSTAPTVPVAVVPSLGGDSAPTLTGPATPVPSSWFTPPPPSVPEPAGSPNAPPGLRRRSLSMPPLATAAAPAPAVPVPGATGVARPSNIVAAAVPPPPPPPTLPPTELPKAPGANGAPVDSSQAATELAPVQPPVPKPLDPLDGMKTEELSPTQRPSSPDAHTVPMRPAARERSVPGLVWVALFLVAAGGAGTLALAKGWIHPFAMNPQPQAPLPPPPAPTLPAPAPVPAPVPAPPPEPVAAEPVEEAPVPVPEKKPPARTRPAPVDSKAGRAEATKLQRAGYRQLGSGDIDGALSSFKKAIALNPVAALAYRGLGAAYSAKGNSREAAKAYRKYLALNPHAQDAAEVRALVQQLQ
jgi:hypothetical protein